MKTTPPTTTPASSAASDHVAGAARRLLAVVVAAGLALVVALPTGAVTDPADPVATDGPQAHRQGLLVASHDVHEVATVVADLDNRAQVEEISRGWVRVDLEPAAADQLRQRLGAAVTEDPPMRLLAPAADPLTWLQWHLGSEDGVAADRTAQGIDGDGVVVAVIDSGIDTSHPDLVRRMWTNPGEDCGNGVDDDGNGHVDDCHGWDFANDDATVDDGSLAHGTHVASTVAASANGSGVLGVAPGARIMAVKVIEQGAFPTSRLVQAIDYAVANGAQVINLSVGTAPGHEPIEALEQALGRAVQDGVLVVVAAGNDAVDLSVQPVQPAATDVADVVVVGAAGRGHEPAAFSNRGLPVDLHAPGVSVWAAAPGGRYVPMSGTSMATPVVSGVAALALQAAQGNPAAARRALLEGAATPGGIAGHGCCGRFARVDLMLGRLGLDASPRPGTGPSIPDLTPPDVVDPGRPDVGDDDQSSWSLTLVGDGEVAAGERLDATVQLHGTTNVTLVGVALARGRVWRAPDLVVRLDGREMALGGGRQVRDGTRVTVTVPAGAYALAAVDEATAQVQLISLMAVAPPARPDPSPLQPAGPGAGAIAPTSGPSSGGTAVRIDGPHPGAVVAVVGTHQVPIYRFEDHLRLFTRPHAGGVVDIELRDEQGRTVARFADAFTFQEAPRTGRAPAAAPLDEGLVAIDAGSPLGVLDALWWLPARCRALPCTATGR